MLIVQCQLEFQNIDRFEIWNALELGFVSNIWTLRIQ